MKSMVKIVGIMCLLLGCCGLSFDKIKREKGKLNVLIEIRDFAAYLCGEIEYSHIPIPDICREYLKRSEGSIKMFLDRLCRRLEEEKGQSFDIVWEEIAEKYVVEKEEKRQLKKLGGCFGFPSIGMQVSSLERYLKDIEKIIVHNEKKFQDNRKLILYFGVMSGLLLSIILL